MAWIEALPRTVRRVQGVFLSEVTERVCTYFRIVYFQLFIIIPSWRLIRFWYWLFIIMTFTMLSDDVFRLAFTEYEGVHILGNLEIWKKNTLLFFEIIIETTVHNEAPQARNFYNVIGDYSAPHEIFQYLEGQNALF